MRRVRALFSREVATVIIAYALTLLLAIAFAEAWVARQQATGTLHQTQIRASHRVDQLQQEISRLQDRLRNTSTRDAQERGRLEDAIQALVTQLRQAHLEPVTTGQPSSPTPSPSPSPTRTTSPRPIPEPSHAPHPSPSPSPTCIKALGKSVCIQEAS